MKIYRVQLTLPTNEPKIFKVKANSYDEAVEKLKSSMKFDEMLSEDEIVDVSKGLDKILDILNSWGK